MVNTTVKDGKTYVNIKELFSWSKNPRAIKKEDFERLKRQVIDLKIYKPLLITPEGEVLGGNMRLEAYKALGIDDVWVSVVTPKTEAEKVKYALSDNDRAGYYVEEELAELVSQYELDLNLDDFRIDLGNGLSLRELLAQYSPDEVIEDEPPAVEDEAISKTGEVYQLGNHRLMCGDATKIEDVEKLMDGQKADMVFTDPPYNVDYEGKTKERLKIQNDRNSLVEFREMISSVIDNMVVFTKRGGCYYVCIPLEVGVTDLFVEKTHLQSVIIWLKNIIVMGRKDYQQKTEPILFMTNIEDKGYTEENTYRGIVYGWKAGDSHDFYGGRKQSNVWEFDKPSKNKEHPTMKPIALCAKAITNSSIRGASVLDVFGGSGSTLIACEQLDRKCFMMELDPKYCDVIRKRYANFIGKGEKWQEITPIVTDK